jgi:hypothetical protein
MLMPESFVQDAAAMGYPPDWDGSGEARQEPAREIKELSEISEVESDLSFDELSEVVLKAALDIWFIQKLNLCSQRYGPSGSPFPGVIPVEAFDGVTLQDLDLHDQYLEIAAEVRAEMRECLIPLRLLIEVLRETGAPFYYPEDPGGWVAWNDEEECLSLVLGGNRDEPTRRMWRESDVSENSVQMLISRCRVTTDHGQKPLLVHLHDVERVKAGAPVPFRHLSSLSWEALDMYALAFVGSSGSVRTVALQRAAEESGEIPTRCGTYIAVSGGLRAEFEYGRLLVDAFHLAVSVPPHRMGCFRMLVSGTIFQPSLVAHRIPDFRRKMDAPTAVRELKEFTDALGSVYLTSGLPPFDQYTKSILSQHDHLVTTPELYERAVRSLTRHGWCLIVRKDDVAVLDAVAWAKRLCNHNIDADALEPIVSAAADKCGVAAKWGFDDPADQDAIMNEHHDRAREANQQGLKAQIVFLLGHCLWAEEKLAQAVQPLLPKGTDLS